MLYTSYYANLYNLKDYTPVSISLSTPVEVDIYLKELAPTWSILSEVKSGGDRELYTRRYKEEILGRLNPHEVIGKIRRVAMLKGYKKLVMLCYEGKGKFCHRHLVSEWLREAGYRVEEI